MFQGDLGTQTTLDCSLNSDFIITDLRVSETKNTLHEFPREFILYSNHSHLNEIMHLYT